MKRFSLRGAQSVVKRKGTEMPPDQIGQHSDTSANSFFHKSKSPFKTSENTLREFPLVIATVAKVSRKRGLWLVVRVNKKNVPQLILAPSAIAIAIIFVCIIFQRFFPFSALTVRKCETKLRVPVVSDRIPLILFLANT